VTARPFTKNQAVNGTFDPETLTAYEAGLKTDLFDRRLRLNLSAFLGKLTNAQIGTSICPDGSTPCAALINGGNAKQKGVELEGTLRPVDGLTIDGSASYIDFYYTSLAAGSTTALTDPRAGLPEWKWTLGAQYELPLPGIGSLTPRIDAAYQAKIYTGAKYQTVPQYIPSDKAQPGRPREWALTVKKEF